MALKKKTKKLKKNAYIEIDGIENQYLDAALLHSVEEEIIYGIILDELKILKKAGISVAEVKKRAVNEIELKNKISPYVLESYTFYNFLVNHWYGSDKQLIDISNFEETLENEWLEIVTDILNGENILLYEVINSLRFYKNGEYKSLIPMLFSEEINVLKFYEETGIQVECGIIDWERKKLNEVNDDGNEDYSDEIEEDEDLIFSSTEALNIAANLINDVASKLSKFEEKENFNELYKAEKERNDGLSNENLALNKEVKSINSQIKILEKEKKNSDKSVIKLNQKIDGQQKEIGKMGLQIGEYRIIIDSLENSNKSLKLQVEAFNKDKKKNEEKIAKEIHQENNLRSLKMKVDFEEKAKEYEEQIGTLEKQFKESSENNVTLSSSLESTMKELERIKSNFSELEEENNKIKEKLNSKITVSLEEPIDEEIDFSEEDLGAFIGFDNKPIRN